MIPNTNNDDARPGGGLLKEFTLIFGLFVCLILIVGWFHYFYASRSLQVVNNASESTSVALGRSSIEGRIGNVRADLLFLAENARNLGLFDSPLPGLRQQLKLLFLTLIQQHSEYDQVRYLDDSGREIVRVNYNNGRPYAVPDSLLQDKRTRYYFEKTWALDQDQVYLSPMDLNMEQGRIETPQKPVLRFSTPVFDSRGRKTGILIINYLGKGLLDNFRGVTVHVADHIELVNHQGFWLSHPGREREWGFMYGLEDTFGNEWPQAWQIISQDIEGQFQTDDGLFSFSTIDLLSPTTANNVPSMFGASHQWKIISHLPPDRLSAAPLFYGYLPVYGVTILILAVASFLVARTRVRHHQIQAETEFEQRFRLALENIDLLAVAIDADGSIKFCNDALLELTGWERGEVLEKNWFERFIPPANLERYRSEFEDIISQRSEVAHHDDKLLTRNGELLDVTWNDTLMLDADKHIVGLTCIGENVTEARMAEQELHKLSRVVEQSPSTVMIVDTQGEIEYVNPMFSQLTGYSREEIIGQNPRLLKSGNTEAKVYRELWNAISAGKEWRGVFQNRKKNGELYWESAVISALRGRGGEITHYIAVKEDITARLRLETRFQHVFEAAPNAMIMVDHSGTIVLVNSEADRCFGYEREDLIGQPVEILLPDRYREAHPDLVKNFLTAPTSRKLGGGRDLYGRRCDGTVLTLEIGLSPVETDDGLFVLCSFIDTSERNRLMTELERSNQEMAKAETLATVGKMANMVAHDLRNPLSSVKMSLQILGKRAVTEWSDEELELHSIALEQVGHMERIMQDLLNYSRNIALKPEWIQLDKLIDAVILLTQRQISEKKIQIRTWHQPGLPTLHGDPDKLRQVFSNLIINAVDATVSNGDRAEIAISTHLALGDDHPYIRVEIEDRGPGIAEEIAEKIFEPFFTTRSKGTGLGLAIVRRIVEAHGGDIHFEKLDGPGARAVVTLPTILPGDRRKGLGDDDTETHATAKETSSTKTLEEVSA